VDTAGRSLPDGGTIRVLVVARNLYLEVVRATTTIFTITKLVWTFVQVC